MFHKGDGADIVSGEPLLDLVVKSGLVVDGTGNPWFLADVCIDKGRIVKLGHAESDPAEAIDASGLIVSPGSIDIHSHSDFTLVANPRAESKIRQGVTTEVVGNCGDSAAPAVGRASESARRSCDEYGIPLEWSSFGDYLEIFDRQGVAVNVAALVGHGTVRRCVMGLEKRLPRQDELEEMKSLVDRSMKEGAFGVSTGLVYPPGRFAETDELVELSRVVAGYGGIYASHIRGQRETMIEAVKEAIEIGEKAGISVQISHIPPMIGAWGRSGEILKLIDDARDRDIDVTCDMHTYMAGSTGLSALLPPWVQEGGPSKIVERVSNRETRERIRRDMIEEPVPGPGPCGLVKRNMWDKIVLSSCGQNTDLIGKSFAEIARFRNADAFDAYFDVLKEENASGAVVGFYYNEEDSERVLRHHVSMIGSDGYALAPYGVLGKGRKHPRSYGAFPQVLARHVRKRHTITLEEAIRKMSSAAARRLKLKDRGLIREGMWADIVVFDKNTVEDTATYLEPYQYPRGIRYVIVNGKVVIRDGEHTGALPGKALRFAKTAHHDPIQH